MKYTLAVALLVTLPSIAHAQSGTRGGAPTNPTVPQGSGARALDNSAPALGPPVNQGAPSNESYSVPPSGSGTRGDFLPAPYAEQSPQHAQPQPSNCGHVQSFCVPVQANYARPVYYRPYYSRRFFGGRRHYFGY